MTDKCNKWNVISSGLLVPFVVSFVNLISSRRSEKFGSCVARPSMIKSASKPYRQWRVRGSCVSSVRWCLFSFELKKSKFSKLYQVKSCFSKNCWFKKVSYFEFFDKFFSGFTLHIENQRPIVCRFKTLKRYHFNFKISREIYRLSQKLSYKRYRKLRVQFSEMNPIVG